MVKKSKYIFDTTLRYTIGNKLIGNGVWINSETNQVVPLGTTIKNSDGSYRQLNSDGTYTILLNNLENKKLDYKINLVNPNSPEGLAQMVKEKIKSVPETIKAALTSQNNNLVKNIDDKLFSFGNVAEIIAKNGFTNVDDFIQQYVSQHTSEILKIASELNVEDDKKSELIVKSIISSLNDYANIVEKAFDGSRSDNLLTQWFGSNKPIFSDRNIAKRFANFLNSENLDKNWSLYQIRAIGEGKANNALTLERNKDYYSRIYSLSNGENKIGDFITDTAVEILATKGLGVATKGLSWMARKISPKAIESVDKALNFTNKIGIKTSAKIGLNIPLSKGAKKAVANVIQTPISIASDMVTHPISTFGSSLLYTDVYKPYYDKYYEPTINKVTGDYVSKDLIPEISALILMSRLRNQTSQGLLDNVVRPEIFLRKSGLAQTYKNDWVSQVGASKLGETLPTPYSASVANFLNPIKEGVLIGTPYSILTHYGINPGRYVTNLTGSELLGNAVDFGIAGHVGNKVKNKIATAEYLRGNGATSIVELGNGIAAGYTINKNGIQTDPISYKLSLKHPKLAGIYRMSASYLPHNFLSPTGHYTGFFEGLPGVGTKYAAPFIKSEKFSSSKDAMVSTLSEEHGLLDVPGGIVRRKTYVAGSSTKHLNPVERDAVESAFSLGRFKKGLIVELTFSGDWTRFVQGVTSGTIVPMRGTIDKNGNFIPLFDKNGNPTTTEKLIVGRQGAIPVGSSANTLDKGYLYYFDTQGHLVDLWYDTKTGEVLYRSMDNSGLGRASRSNEGQNALTSLKLSESAFIDLNQRLAFNVNINGGPSAIGGKGKKIVETKSEYNSIEEYRKDNPFTGKKTEHGQRTREYSEYLSRTKSEYNATLNEGGRGEWNLTTFKHIVAQLYPWNPAKMSFKEYREFIEEQAHALAEHSAYGAIYPTSRYLDNYKRKIAGDTSLPKEALIDSYVGPLGLPTIEIAKQIGWITN